MRRAMRIQRWCPPRRARGSCLQAAGFRHNRNEKQRHCQEANSGSTEESLARSREALIPDRKVASRRLPNRSWASLWIVPPGWNLSLSARREWPPCFGWGSGAEVPVRSHRVGRVEVNGSRPGSARRILLPDESAVVCLRNILRKLSPLAKPSKC